MPTPDHAPSLAAALTAKHRAHLCARMDELIRLYEYMTTQQTQGLDIRRDSNGNVAGSASFADCLFLYLCVLEYRPQTIFEIGTWIGTSSVFMTEALAQIGSGTVHTCDVNDYRVIPEQYTNIVFHHTHSSRALDDIDAPIDFVFADGTVTPATAWKLRSAFQENGVFATHDFKPPIDKGVQNLLLMRLLRARGYEHHLAPHSSIDTDTKAPQRVNSSIALITPAAQQRTYDVPPQVQSLFSLAWRFSWRRLLGVRPQEE